MAGINRNEFWARYSCVYVTREQREELGRLLNLPTGRQNEDDRELWRIADYLLWGTSRDSGTDFLILSLAHMRDICGRSKTSKKLVVKDKIAEFEARTGAKVRLTGWSNLTNTARLVIGVDWGVNADAINDLVHSCCRPRAKLKDRVALDTGKRCLKTDLKAMRLKTQEECVALIAEAGNEDAIRLLTYLNNLPPTEWANVEQHLPALRDVAGREAKHADYSLKILLKAEACAQPYYRPTDKSSRVYAVGSNILGLHRNVRKTLFEWLGWYSFDLKAAQLAILSKTWDVPELRHFLSTGENFWQVILTHMGWTAEKKDVLKRALYGLAFGAGKDRLREVFAEAHDSDIELGKKSFLQWRKHPLISALYSARLREIKRIRAAGFAVDCYGRRYNVVTCRSENEKGRNYQESNVRSIMACLAQAWELMLLAPALEIIEGAPKSVQLTYWLHDGFGVSCPENHKAVLDRIVAAVNATCEYHDIPTSLEFD